jgi:hypothetical protein
MKTVTDLFTRADYLRLPEDFPAQLIEGRLVKEAVPLYGHQWWALKIRDALIRVVPEDRVLLGPLEVSIDEFNSYHPDVAVFAERPPFLESGTRMPIAVFEVLSPSTQRYDRARSIERHDRDGPRVARHGERIASEAVSGFSLSVSDLDSPAR